MRTRAGTSRRVQGQNILLIYKVHNIPKLVNNFLFSQKPVLLSFIIISKRKICEKLSVILLYIKLIIFNRNKYLLLLR